MDNKKHTTDIEQDIELVDIEDLRTAFGGEGHEISADNKASDAPSSTVMCTGWYKEN